MIDAFQLIGRDMYQTGLVSSHNGTMSVREEGRVRVSRRGAMLGHLEADDLLDISLEDTAPEGSPEDVLIHQSIYRQTDAGAVVYARPPWTMALALIEDRLSPANDDGAESLGTVPVLISQRALSSPDIAQIIARSLKESRVVALRGHGVFARGSDLGDALRVLSLLEEMCKVVHLYRSLVGEEPQPVIRDRQERSQQGTPFRSRTDSGNRQGSGRSAPQRTPGGGPPRRNDNANRRPPNENRSGPGGRRPPHR